MARGLLEKLVAKQLGVGGRFGQDAFRKAIDPDDVGQVGVKFGEQLGRLGSGDFEAGGCSLARGHGGGAVDDDDDVALLPWQDGLVRADDGQEESRHQGQHRQAANE